MRVLPLRAPVVLPLGGGLACRVSMARSDERHRTLDVSLEYAAVGPDEGAAGAGGAADGAVRRDVVSFSMEIGGA